MHSSAPSSTERWKSPSLLWYELYRMRDALIPAIGSLTEKGAPKKERVPAATIGVRVLLVSGDIQTIDTLCESMGKMAMHVDICSDFASATSKLCHSKFEALVVDFKERAEALELLKKSREMTSHKAAVVLAILN